LRYSFFLYNMINKRFFQPVLMKNLPSAGEENRVYAIKQYLGDDQGRFLLLRGCNLGGSSKIPFFRGAVPAGAAALQNPGEASFVGRPFPAEEAGAHFERLRRWGLTFVRFLITWEALEPQGPGIYDEAYLAHLRKILLAAEEWGIAVFMDPHQDVWSRWTGGTGLPPGPWKSWGWIGKNSTPPGPP
jgi:hypothetical protein